VTSAFDAWWTSVQPPFQRVPDDAPSWWHGRGSEFGYRLYDRRGPAQHHALDTLPLAAGYAPQCRMEDRRQCQFKRTVVTSNGDVYTILSWWDLGQDSAAVDVSSCFVVRGDHAYSSEALVEAFPLHFPAQAIQLAAAGGQLVEALGQDL